MKKLTLFLLALTISLTALSQTSISTAGGVTGSGTIGYLPRFTAAKRVANSAIFQSGSNIGIGTTSPGVRFQINGASPSSNSFMAFYDLLGNIKIDFKSQGRILCQSYLDFKGFNNTGVVRFYSGTNEIQPSDGRPSLEFYNSIGSNPFSLGLVNDDNFGLFSPTFGDWIYTINKNSGIFSMWGLTTNGPVRLQGLPTSSAGLPSGSIWINAGVLSIVP